MTSISILLYIFCTYLYFTIGANLNEFRDLLHSSSVITEKVIQMIYQEWRIDKYPNFLKSCYMHKSSWELMKLKFMYKILSSKITEKSQDFIISFLGSSVAAGHDSWFNQSYPVVVGVIMEEAFKPLNINLITKNVALGNNPCVPYDICVKIFAGIDADIVQWEQTYNCPHDPPIMEEFVRQSLLIPSKPIVVFAESHTGTWKSEICTSIRHKTNITASERELLHARPLSLVSSLNKDEFKRAWNHISDITRIYGSAGIQTFTHTRHEPYKCQGPYVPEWQQGAANWHPSYRSHRLRASQMAYFWLQGWRDAIDELHIESHSRSIEDMLKETVRKLHGFYYHSYQHSKDVARRHHLPEAESSIKSSDTSNTLSNALNSLKLAGNDVKALLNVLSQDRILLPKHIHQSLAIDDIQCFTDYEPRSVVDSSLLKQVIGGMATSNEGKGWKSIIYENLVRSSLVEKSRARGYKDFKYLLYGNMDDGPISFAIRSKQLGQLMICETPGIWGSLPKGFDHLWATRTEIYLQTVPAMPTSVTFSKENSMMIEFQYIKQLDICMQSTTNITIGNHVLTVVPRNESKIIIAWLLVP